MNKKKDVMVSIVMGSDSDLSIMAEAAKTLDESAYHMNCF